MATRIAYLDALLRPALTEEFDSSQKSTTLRSVVSQFDAQGRPTYASYPQRTAITSIYFTGAAGTNPLRPGTKTRYDAIGRVADTEADTETIPGVTSKARTTITYTYDGKRVVDPRGNWTRTYFQMFDEPTEDAPILVEDAKGSTTITRDVFSRTSAMTRGSWTRQYFYDANNRLCKQIDPETSVAILDYDAAGNTAWKATGLFGTNFDTPSNASNCQRANVGTYAYSAKTVMAYDDRNRLTTTTPRGYAGVADQYGWGSGGPEETAQPRAVR